MNKMNKMNKKIQFLSVLIFIFFVGVCLIAFPKNLIFSTTIALSTEINSGCNNPLTTLSQLVDGTPSQYGHKWRSIICVTIPKRITLKRIYTTTPNYRIFTYCYYG